MGNVHGRRAGGDPRGRHVVLLAILSPVAAALSVRRKIVVSLGLLFVVLDGYAAWKVDMGGVTDRMSAPERYAAAVFAFTAVLGLVSGAAPSCCPH